MTWLVFQVYNKNEDFYAAVEVLPAPIRAFVGCEIQLQCPPGRTGFGQHAYLMTPLRVT
jgi:hypothetical protein